MKTITLNWADVKPAIYAMHYGNPLLLNSKIKEAIAKAEKVLWSAKIIVLKGTEVVLELPWFDADYPARPVNPAADRALDKSVQHNGLAMDLDRSEWSRC